MKFLRQKLQKLEIVKKFALFPDFHRVEKNDFGKFSVNHLPPNCRFQLKVINFLNAIFITYLNTCTSVLIDTKYSAYWKSPNEKKSENFNSKLLNFFKKTQISIEIS